MCINAIMCHRGNEDPKMQGLLLREHWVRCGRLSRRSSNYCGRNCTTKQGMEDEDVFNDFKPVIYRINVPLVTLIPLSSSVCDQKKKKAISVTWGKAVPLSVPNWLLLRTLPIPVIMFWNWRQGRWYHGVDCRVIQHIQGVKRCRIWAAR